MTNSNKLECDHIDKHIQEGVDDETILESIARCLREDVRRFAMARCGDRRGDLEDITQDVMLSAQRYLKTFRGESSLRTWLYKLVLSACSRSRRGRKNDPSLHQPLENVNEITDPSNPEVSTLFAERLQALHQAIEGLRPQDRELLAAVEWEELSLREVGERFGLSISAMKSRMFRIRKQLRERVESSSASIS